LLLELLTLLHFSNDCNAIEYPKYKILKMYMLLFLPFPENVLSFIQGQ